VPTAIAIEKLCKMFPSVAGAKPAAAVQDVSLEIRPGELFFLIGPSGCGKTTLLRMIAGFIEPTSGRVVFRDDAGTRDVTFEPANTRNTGMVFQSYALWPHMTVEQNVAFGLEVRKVDGATRARKVRDALELVQMGEYAKRKPTQLSGGQQQRIALARAMVIGPAVLLLDEPLSNLDAKLRIELRAQIRSVCKAAGITGIYVTHDQKEALSMADRIAVLKAGQVCQIGTPHELYYLPATPFVASFMGETNLIRGTVTSINGDRSSISTDFGIAIASHKDARVGAAVLLSVRPESIRLHPLGSGNGPTCRVHSSTFLGENTQFEIASGANTLRVSVTGSSRVVADECHVEFLPDAATIVSDQ